jgi:hypothetical protein
MVTPTKEQIDKVVAAVKEFKDVIDKKGSKEEIVEFLAEKTKLPKEVCDKAYDLHKNVKIPEGISNLFGG